MTHFPVVGNKIGRPLALAILLLTLLPSVLLKHAVQTSTAGAQTLNLVNNPSYEAGTTQPQGWVPWQAGPCPAGWKTLTWDKSSGSTGTSSVRISVDPAAGSPSEDCSVFWLSDLIPLDPSTSYSFSAYVRSAAGATGIAWVIAYDAEEHWLGARGTYMVRSDLQWFRLGFELPAHGPYFPAGTAKIRLHLDATPLPSDGSFGQAASVWFDDVSLVPFGALPSSPQLTPTPTPILAPKVRALSQLNYYRGLVGLPTVDEDATLSQGTDAHAQYLVLNRFDPVTQGLGVHDEATDKPGYTPQGVAAGPRSVIATGRGLGPWEDAIDEWMETVYHRIPLIDPGLQAVGLGHAWEETLHSWEVYVLDKADVGDAPAASYPVVFPASGQANVPTSFDTQEFPDPLPAGVSYPVGYPITVTFAPDDSVRITCTSLMDSQGTPVATYSLMPHSDDTIGNSLALIPQQPLKRAEVYSVIIEGSLNGSSFNKSWSFATVGAIVPGTTPSPASTATPTPAPTATPTPAPTATPSPSPTPTPARSGAVPVAQGLGSIAGSYTLLITFDASDAQDAWKLYDPAAPAFANDLNQLEAGRAYWLKVSQPARLSYGSRSYSLVRGWNLVGWLG